jgi:hypothetical protein
VGQESGAGHRHLALGLRHQALGLGDLRVLARELERLVEGQGGARAERQGEEQVAHSNLRAVMGSSREALWAG